MSDFVVAYRTIQPRLGQAWLPAFASIYLAVVLAVLLGWVLAPLATLLLFLLVSGLHFGTDDVQDRDAKWPAVAFLARATTPLLPIFLLHANETGPYLATMTGSDPSEVVTTLLALGPYLILPWAIVVVVHLLTSCGAGPDNGAAAQAMELGALALAAVILPPLMTFAVYFCLMHAVRHMAHLTAGIHPRHPGRALQLGAIIILPAALVCIAVLAALWSGISGLIATNALLCGALQLTAALTVPHMALEALSRRQPRALRSRGPRDA